MTVIGSILISSTALAVQPVASFGGAAGCKATLDSPHPSMGYIKSHMRISCVRKVAAAHVEARLWRLRWWGWEAVTDPTQYDKKDGGRTFDTAARFKPDSGCYYYRSTGSGFVIGFDGTRYDTPGVGVNYDQRFSKGRPAGCGASW